MVHSNQGPVDLDNTGTEAPAEACKIEINSVELYLSIK